MINMYDGGCNELKHQIILSFDISVADPKKKFMLNFAAHEFINKINFQAVVNSVVSKYADQNGNYDEEDEIDITQELLNTFEHISKEIDPNEPGNFILYCCRPKRIHINHVMHGGFYDIPTDTVTLELVNRAINMVPEGIDISFVVFPFWLMVPYVPAFYCYIPTFKEDEEMTDEEIEEIEESIYKWEEAMLKRYGIDPDEYYGEIESEDGEEFTSEDDEYDYGDDDYDEEEYGYEDDDNDEDE